MPGPPRAEPPTPGSAPLRPVALDGSPRAVGVLVAALSDALAGGPAVLPLAPGQAAAPAAPADGPPGSRAVAAHDAELLAGAAAVVATSGSSGEPKLVVLPVAALLASAGASADRLGGPARWLLALPAEHVAGVQVIARALLAGAPPVVQDLRGGFRPEDFAAASARIEPGARRCTSLVPTQLLRLLDAGGQPLAALRGYAAVLVGGAALDPGLRARAEEAGVRVVTTYGMTETAGGCVYDGVPLDGVSVELAAADAGTAGGRVLLGGPTLAAGYLGRPRESAAAFAGGRFRTGDLGRWQDGRLLVLGRADDVIITGGEKVAPGAVERVLAAQPGVRECCVVGLPDPQWGQVVAAAVVVTDHGRPPDAAPLLAAVRAALGRQAVPRHLVAVTELPLRGVGKPDRAAVRELLARAERHPVEQTTPSGWSRSAH